ncbi:hypothetical protein EXIGLDRAFT_830755 [Exidia glandulosa HHB12029]|uniref:BTB domain-containing protein n=1 Tax=Exidia glandulosa HHB12029 TaxID=1314781 RepID=A0A165N7T1_EXIGL|nr:hypothetical protein EXIGLDRAFT_830755 [Exidia glandulosa HHB12029]
MEADSTSTQDASSTQVTSTAPVPTPSLPPPPPTPTRFLPLWFNDGNLVLQLGQKWIIKVYRHATETQSTLLKESFENVAAANAVHTPKAAEGMDVDHPVEGAHDDYPICLYPPAGFTDDHLLLMFQYLFPSSFGPNEPKITSSDHLPLMHVAHMYGCAKVFNKAALGYDVARYKSMSPMRRLHLAVQFDMEKWKLLALNELMGLPLFHLTEEHIQLLKSIRRPLDGVPDKNPDDLYGLILRIRTKVLSTRLKLVTASVDIARDASCSLGEHEQCNAAWLLYWSSTFIPTWIGGRVLYESEAVDLLRGPFPLLPMNKACQSTHLKTLQDSGMFTEEGEILTAGTKLAVKYHL